MSTLISRIVFAVLLGATLSCTSTNSASSGAADCKTVCARIAEPKCPATKPGCEEECAKTPPTCPAEMNAYMSCAKAATFTCDAKGNPEAPACNAQVQALVKCFLGGGSDAGVDAQCNAICRSVAAQNCPGDQNTDCGLGCTFSRDRYVSAGCGAEGAALLRCQETATSWRCATDGAVADACASAQTALSTCLTTPKDGGVDAQ